MATDFLVCLVSCHYMDGILPSDSNMDTLEKVFEEVKKVLPKWGLYIASKKYSVYFLSVT